MLSPSPSRLPWGTLRARLAIWNTAVVLSMTVATLVAVRLAAWTTIYDRADDELRSGAQEVVLAMEALFPDMDAVVAELRRKAASHEKRGWFTQLLREDGTNAWRTSPRSASTATSGCGSNCRISRRSTCASAPTRPASTRASPV
jgi:hypothetical protein